MQPHFKTTIAPTNAASDAALSLELFSADSAPEIQTRFVAHRLAAQRRFPVSSIAFAPTTLTLTAIALLSLASSTRSAGAAPAKTYKAPILLAQGPTVSQNPSNAPAAQPAEPANPSVLEVPVGPEKEPPATPNVPATTPSTTAASEAATATPPVETTPPASPGDAIGTGATPDAGDGADVDVNLEGRTIATVRVVGNRVVPPETILQQATGTRVGGIVSANQLQGDLRRIDALGFFVSVQQQVTPNLDDASKVDVTFVVIENRPVTGFTFVGNARIPAADLQAALTTKIGTVLNRNSINTDVGKLQGLYSDRGLAALVTESRQTEDGTVVFTLQEARIGRIDISGLRKTNEGLVRKLIRSKRGEAFDQLAVRRDLNAIYDTGLFDDISYKVTDDTKTPGSVIVTISVKEKRTGQFSVGFSFDNRSKLGGFVTVGENNLFGQGKRAAASVELGSQRTFELSFGDSYVGPKNASYDISLYNRLIFREPRLVSNVLGTPVDTNFQYQEKRTGLRFNFTSPRDDRRTTSLLFGFRVEKAQLEQTSSSSSGSGSTNKILNSSGRVTAFSGGFLRDKRDLQTDPSTGGRQQFIVEQAVKLLGSTASFTKVDLDLRQYIPLIGPPKNLNKGTIPLPRLVLAGRAVYGKAFGQLPAFEQYYVGGSDTVRGYDADTQFGDNQFYTNVELRYRLNQQFQLVGFTDAGKAFGGRYSTDLVNSKVLFSVGAGIRVKTPIGPVRLDVARGSRGVKTHFGIGSTF